MFNRSAFRVFLAKDTGQVVGGSLAAAQGFFGGTSTKPKEKAKKKYTLKNGSQDANILNLLKAMRGAKGEKGENTRDGENYTLAELADMLPKSRGEGKVEPQSLKGRISQIVGWLKAKGIDAAKIAAIMPSDYHSGQRGRRSTLTEASAEQAVNFFADVPEVETDEDEGEEADAEM